MTSIRSAIVQLIEASNMSQTLIAGKADVSVKTVQNILSEKGEIRGINSETAEQIAAVFGKKFVLVDIVPEICEELSVQQGIYGFADSTTGENDDQ